MPRLSFVGIVTLFSDFVSLPHERERILFATGLDDERLGQSTSRGSKVTAHAEAVSTCQAQRPAGGADE